MSEKILLDFMEINKDIYVKWDSVLKMINLTITSIADTKNITDEEKLGWVCGIECLRENLNHESGKFASEIELDSLGIGDGQTKHVRLKIKE